MTVVKLVLDGMGFEWDENKDASNRRKHGITLAAAQVFRDPLRVSIQDRFVDGEARWQTYGVVRNVLLLMVAHTLKEFDGATITRIISARKATRIERRIYENG